MKNKESARPKRPSAVQAGRAKPSSATKTALAELQNENAALIARLAAAEDEIKELKIQRDEALNRIDWVIDSIKSLTESGS